MYYFSSSSVHSFLIGQYLSATNYYTAKTRGKTAEKLKVIPSKKKCELWNFRITSNT